MRSSRLASCFRAAAASAAAGALAFLCSCGNRASPSPSPILCYVGGTMRPAMEELVRRYAAATGEKVLLDFGDSGELLIRAEQTRRGDLYVCHDPFMAEGIRKGLVLEGQAVSALEPVIIVQKGNPKDIRGFRDLARPGLRLILTDSEFSTMGYIVDRMARKTGLSSALAANAVSRTRGSGESANAIAMRNGDASLAWNAVAFLRKDKLDAVPIDPGVRLKPGEDTISTAKYGQMELDCIRVTAAILRRSEQPARARRFVAFLASAEGGEVWRSFGFAPLPPDRMVRFPVASAGPGSSPGRAGTLLVHCAAGMRRPIEPLARDFGQARGAALQMNYDGSNRLLGQIKLARRGDIYIAGESEYIDLAIQDGLARKGVTLCRQAPVIMVRKGNPRGIRSLADLLRPGLRIGQGDEKAAAIGHQTVKLLSLHRIDRAAWNRNVVLTTPTVNELGAALRLGTIDAAVAWNPTAQDYAEDVEAVPIDPSRNLVSEVQGAVLSCAEDPGLAQAFLDFLASADSAPFFEKYGYARGKPSAPIPPPKTP